MFDVAGLRYLDSYPGLNYVTMFFDLEKLDNFEKLEKLEKLKIL